jgi:hypothetical protein
MGFAQTGAGTAAISRATVASVNSALLIIVFSSLWMGIRDVRLCLILLSVPKTSREEERFRTPQAIVRFRQSAVSLRTGIGDRGGRRG